LNENLDPLVGQLQHPHDDADRADRMDVVRGGVLDVEGLLRRQEDHPVARQRGLDRLDRHFAADEQRQHHVRKHDDVAHRQQGQLVGNFHVLRRRQVLFDRFAHRRTLTISIESFFDTERIRWLGSAGAAMFFARFHAVSKVVGEVCAQ